MKIGTKLYEGSTRNVCERPYERNELVLVVQSRQIRKSASWRRGLSIRMIRMTAAVTSDAIRRKMHRALASRHCFAVQDDPHILRQTLPYAKSSSQFPFPSHREIVKGCPLAMQCVLDICAQYVMRCSCGALRSTPKPAEHLVRYVDVLDTFT